MLTAATRVLPTEVSENTRGRLPMFAAPVPTEYSMEVVTGTRSAAGGPQIATRLMRTAVKRDCALVAVTAILRSPSKFAVPIMVLTRGADAWKRKRCLELRAASKTGGCWGDEG